MNSTQASKGHNVTTKAGAQASSDGQGRPLKILMGCDTLTPDVNGAARFTERLASGLAERGHDVRLMAPAQDRVGAGIEQIEGQNLTVYRVPSHKLWGHDWIRFVMPLRARAVANTLLDRFQPDAVHVQSHILVGRGLARMAKKRGIRVIATNHIMAENIFDQRTPRWITFFLLRWAWWDADQVLSLADQVTTPTRKAADFLERSTRRRGVLPVSCGINAADYTADLAPRAEKRIAFVGRITIEKCIDVVLRALARLSPELNVKFDIVGAGDQRESLERLAEDLGISDRVVWHGLVSDEDLRSVLTHASVFAIASIAELQSIATMEAMASGLPVVAANAVALPHLVENGQNGYLFEPGNDQELAERISEILNLPHEEFVAMQQASLERVADHDIDRTLDTFTSLYRGDSVSSV